MPMNGRNPGQGFHMVCLMNIGDSATKRRGSFSWIYCCCIGNIGKEKDSLLWRCVKNPIAHKYSSFPWSSIQQLLCAVVQWHRPSGFITSKPNNLNGMCFHCFLHMTFLHPSLFLYNSLWTKDYFTQEFSFDQ